MVNIRFTDKKGKTWIKKFPKTITLREVKFTAKGINPNIIKVEYYRKKKAKHPFSK